MKTIINIPTSNSAGVRYSELNATRFKLWVCRKIMLFFVVVYFVENNTIVQPKHVNSTIPVTCSRYITLWHFSTAQRGIFVGLVLN